MTAKPHSNRPSAEQSFYLLLSATLLLYVGKEMLNGTWLMHSGALFPWRHLKPMPLLSTNFLLGDWLAILAAAVLLPFARHRRTALILGSLAMAASLSQQFSNHGSLILLVLFYLAIAWPRHIHLSYQMIRYQLLLVYAFSAINKLELGFSNGESLLALATAAAPEGLVPKVWLQLFLSPFSAQCLSWLAIAIELLLPVLLLKSPRAGIALAVVFHVALAFLLPGIWPFSSIMIAMAVLFLLPDAKVNYFFLPVLRSIPAMQASSNLHDRVSHP